MFENCQEQVTVLLDPDTCQRVFCEAARRGITASQYASQLISTGLKVDETQDLTGGFLALAESLPMGQ